MHIYTDNHIFLARPSSMSDSHVQPPPQLAFAKPIPS